MSIRQQFTQWWMALTVCLWPAAVLANDTELVFGVVPQESSSKLAEQWSPLLHRLSVQLERPIRFATAPDIPTFERRLWEGHYDIAYMNPYHYTVFSEEPGYRAVAFEATRLIQGIVVVPDSYAAQTLQGLEGETIVFPAPAAFAATILVRAELDRLGVSYTPRYVSSHQSVYLNVQKGFAAAGGGIERTYNAAIEAGLTGTRVLWRSKGYIPHAFAVHPDLPTDDVLKVQAVLTSLHETEEGKRSLDLANLEALAAAKDSDWDEVRALEISSLLAEQEL